MHPYLLAFCGRKESGLTRSVLTAVARIGPNKTLFTTCKHVITQPNNLFIADEDGVMTQATWALIPALAHDLDLAFLFIRQDVPSDRIRINESSIGKDALLTHARNKFGETETPSPFVTHSTPAEHSSFRAELGWSLVDDGLRYMFLKEKDDFKEAKREGVRTFYRVLEMESWPGVSGSALWDKFGSIRGIVCGGDSSTTRLEDGIPRLVYIPAKIIMKETSLILKNPEFRARMLRE